MRKLSHIKLEIWRLTQEVDARFGMLLCELFQRCPGIALPFLMLAAFLADATASTRLAIPKKVEGWSVRHVVGAGPWGGVFNIIISGHVLGEHGHLVSRVLRQQVGRREARYSSSVVVLVQHSDRCLLALVGPG
jgi:hypothetical protein